MRKLIVILMLLLPMVAWADCSLTYQACEKVCQVKHLADESGELGCKSRCVAQRAACVAEQGAKKAAEVGDAVVESTKSFFSGLKGD